MEIAKQGLQRNRKVQSGDIGTFKQEIKFVLLHLCPSKNTMYM